MELCVHNTAAASHPNGLWDLGDPASVHFVELGVEIVTAREAESSLLLLGAEGEQRLRSGSSVELRQLSSGGENRASAVHVDARGDLAEFPEGFELLEDGASLCSGSRANPLVRVTLGDGRVSIHLPRFWQEFPSALRSEGGRFEIATMARTSAGAHELQPGERKRRRLVLRLSADDDDDVWIAHRLAPPTLAECGARAADELFLRAIVSSEPIDVALEELVISPTAFVEKRELIDEYGWRHFGEVPADHESLYEEPGAPCLVSHYNNQYDLVLGFGLQFLRTKDVAWLELMDDLARHVCDIDIYRTDEDRVEFKRWPVLAHQSLRTGRHRHPSHLLGGQTTTQSSRSAAAEGPVPSTATPAVSCFTTG